MNHTEIFEKHLCGKSYRVLAREYKVSHQTIATICQSFSHHKYLSLVISLLADYPEYKHIILPDWRKYLCDEHFYSNKNIKMLSTYSYQLNEEIV